MSNHDIDDHSQGAGHAPSSSGVSRRTLVKTAVGAGVAVAVAGSIGVANAGPTTPRQATANPLAAGAALSTDSSRTDTGAQFTGPVVAHVLNTHVGTLEVFRDGSRTQVRDADLTARITRVAGASPVVVHVTDATTGALEVFSNGSRTEIRSQDLAGRIVRAA